VNGDNASARLACATDLRQDWRIRFRAYRREKLLAEVRAAETMPWESSQLSLYRLIYPKMTLWLPEDEGAQYRLAFDAEMARLAPSA